MVHVDPVLKPAGLQVRHGHHAGVQSQQEGVQHLGQHLVCVCRPIQHSSVNANTAGAHAPVLATARVLETGRAVLGAHTLMMPIQWNTRLPAMRHSSSVQLSRMPSFRWTSCMMGNSTSGTIVRPCRRASATDATSDDVDCWTRPLARPTGP